MNADPTPPNPEEIEQRITALLLGELSAAEATEVRRLIAANPSLSELQSRIAFAIGLVKETTSQAITEQPAQPKMSTARREALQQHFRNEAPEEKVARIPWYQHWAIPLSAAAVFVFLAFEGVLLPSLAKAKSKSSHGRPELEQKLALIDRMETATAEAPGSGAERGGTPTLVQESTTPKASAEPESTARAVGGVGGEWARQVRRLTPSPALTDQKTKRQYGEVGQDTKAMHDTSDSASQPLSAPPQGNAAEELESLPKATRFSRSSGKDANPEIESDPSKNDVALKFGANGPAVEQTIQESAKDSVNGEPSSMSFYLMNPELAKRYGLIPKGMVPSREDNGATKKEKSKLPTALKPSTHSAQADVGFSGGRSGGTAELAEKPGREPVALGSPVEVIQPGAGSLPSSLATRGTELNGVRSEADEPTVFFAPSPAAAGGISKVEGRKAGTPSLALNEVAANRVLAREEALNLAEAPQALQAAPEYKIKKGDTLSKIAKDTGVPLKALVEANANLNPAKLRIGQSVNIPTDVALAETLGRIAEGDKQGLPSLAAPRKSVDLPAKSKISSQSALADEVSAIVRTPAPEPQPEVVAQANAFSTFSLNVTDVSFKLAAASLEAGTLPDPGTIRSEEFINALNYRDPEPAPGVPIGFTWERAHYPFAHHREVVRFAVRTAARGREAGRPLNIVLLLDNSGSMERADRVGILHEALVVLARQLGPQDRISVVSFARTARLWVDALPGNQAGELADRVGNLTPEGGTNLEEALNLAYTTATRHFLPQGVNRVVLLTDGAANLGDLDPESLKAKVESWRKRGVALDCFGVGWEGYNDDLLEVLARNGDGRYGFINTPEEATTEFAAQLAGALNVAASDVKVQVEFNPQRVSVWRQIGYAKHQLTKEQFRDNTVDAAELTAAESGNALYIIETDENGSGPIATVRVRYKNPQTGSYREHAWQVPYSRNTPLLSNASTSLRLAASASAFSEWLAGSPFAGEVTPDALLASLNGVPEQYKPDPRPEKLEWMIRQAKSLSGK